MRTKSTFLAQDAMESPNLAEGITLGKGRRLPMPPNGSNLSPTKPVIGWMPVAKD